MEEGVVCVGWRWVGDDGAEWRGGADVCLCYMFPVHKGRPQ